MTQSKDTLNGLSHLTSQNDLKWHHIPPRAPHFGGLWEAGVNTIHGGTVFTPTGVQSCIGVPDGSSFFKFGLLESSIGAHSTCNNKVSPQYTEKEI